MNEWMVVLCRDVEVTCAYAPTVGFSCTSPEREAITPLSHFFRVTFDHLRTVTSMAMVWGYGEVHHRDTRFNCAPNDERQHSM